MIDFDEKVNAITQREADRAQAVFLAAIPIRAALMERYGPPRVDSVTDLQAGRKAILIQQTDAAEMSIDAAEALLDEVDRRRRARVDEQVADLSNERGEG
jgi:ribosomal protein L13E